MLSSAIQCYSVSKKFKDCFNLIAFQTDRLLPALQMAAHFDRFENNLLAGHLEAIR